MLFNSVPFLMYFLPIAVIGALALRRFGHVELCKWWLLAASAFFYGFWEWRYLALLFGSIFVNFILGRRLAAPDMSPSQRRLTMIGAVAFNLCLLFLFKYFNFFIDNIEFLFGFDINIFKVALPLGISFFTFQQIAFIVDAYERKHSADYSFVDYAVFVSFFPQLIAGPIVHHNDFVPQLKSDVFARPTAQMFASGLAIIIIGLFKKAVLADGLAPTTDSLFADAAQNGLTFFEAWLAALSFAGQIYFDFSGYSDIAIGLALLFGLAMPENFAAPYRASSIIDFWRRWHMTLSAFLRDYLYIPLGGNRRGSLRRYANLMATMLLGGLWHGAAWTFVIWGGLHGAYLTVNHLFNEAARGLKTGMGRLGAAAAHAAGWAATFWAVCFAWIFFRAENLPTAFNVASGFVGVHGVYIPHPYLNALLSAAAPSVAGSPGSQLFSDPALGNDLAASAGFTAVAMLIAILLPKNRASQTVRLAAVVLITGFVIQAVFFGKASEEFIYFQF